MAGLTDEEMAALEAKEGLSDEQLAAKESMGRETQHRKEEPGGTLGSTLAEAIRRRRDALPDQIRSALAGVTNNVAPRALAALEGVRGSLTPGATFSGEYDKALPEYQRQYETAAREHPVANVVGAVAQPSPFGKLGAASKVGKVALGGARVGQAAGTGALAQYMNGGDAGNAALLGGGIQLAAEGVSPILGKVAGGLRTTAGNAAASAAGLRGGIVNQAKRAGIPVLDAASEANIPNIGNQMLDEGLIPFGGSKTAVLKRAEKAMDMSGNAAASIRTRADLAGKFDPTAGADAAAARLAERIDPTKGGNLQTARAAARAQDFIDDARATPGTFEAADNLKRGAYGNTNWSTEAPDAAKLKRTAVSGYRQSIEDQVDKLLPGEGKALHDINSKYGLAAQTADFAEEAAGREAANQKFGWGSLMLGAAGAGAGGQISPLAGGLAGVGLPAAAHFMKTRGAAVAAPIARLGSMATGAAAGAVNKSPAASGATGSLLADYLQPKEDEERQEEGASNLVAKMGGR